MKIIKKKDGQMFVAKNTRRKLDEEAINDISRYIRLGCYVETAMVLSGFSKDDFYNWCKEGQNSTTGLKRQFFDAVKKALAEAELRDIARIDKAIEDGNWQAAAWRLERKFPARWGRRGFLEVEHSITHEDSPLAIKDLTMEDIKNRILELSTKIQNRILLVSTRKEDDNGR